LEDSIAQKLQKEAPKTHLPPDVCWVK
jgi:hypothetical protein